MSAPHVYFPDTFDVTVSTDSTINTTYYAAFDADMNQVRVQGNFSALDFKPKTFIDVYADLRRKNISMIKDNMCKFFTIPANTSLPVLARLFNLVPLVTLYDTNSPKSYHNFMLNNPLGTGEDNLEVTMVFKEMDIEEGRKDFPFTKVIIKKLKKELPETLELVVLEKVTERHFEEGDFHPKVECQEPTKEVQEYFDKVYQSILDFIQGLV